MVAGIPDSEKSAPEEYYWGAGFKLNFLNLFISAGRTLTSHASAACAFFDL
jgi:hypothetical protein